MKRDIILDLAVGFIITIITYSRPTLLINFANTVFGRLLTIAIITALSLKDTVLGLLGVLLFVSFRESMKKLGKEGMKNQKDDMPSQEAIDKYDEAITAHYNLGQKECANAGTPNEEILKAIKMGMFPQDQTASKAIVRMFHQKEDPYRKMIIDKSKNKAKAEEEYNKTFDSLIKGCYNGYNIEVNMITPENISTNSSQSSSNITDMRKGFF